MLETTPVVSLLPSSPFSTFPARVQEAINEGKKGLPQQGKDCIIHQIIHTEISPGQLLLTVLWYRYR